MMDLKILILMCYYDRPQLIRGYLRSLLEADRLYGNWEMAFIDDGSIEKGRPIVEKILGDKASRVRFSDTEMTPDMKEMGGGTFIGHYMNEAIRESDADLVIMMGDDDEFVPGYLEYLNWFFSNNPECMSAYCDAYVFNPLTEMARHSTLRYSDDPKWIGHEWFGKPINAAMKVDGIQVCWRRECCSVYGAWFDFPFRINHDAAFFEELHARTQPTEYMGCTGVYKGRHAGQLVNRSQMAKGVRDKKKARMLV